MTLGWVFSKYVNIEQSFTSEIFIEKASINKWGENTLDGYYMLAGYRVCFTVSAYKQNTQDYYAFSWNFRHDKYHYSNIPGCYIWYPDTNEIKHITYLGGETSSWGFSSWIKVTNDKRYLIEDFGTAPPPRNVKIWDIKKNELIFDGLYFEDINLRDNIINVIYSYRSYYNNWSMENEKLEKDILEFARTYFDKNPVDIQLLNETKKTGIGISLIIVCDYYLDTRQINIIECKYIKTQ